MKSLSDIVNDVHSSGTVSGPTKEQTNAILRAGLSAITAALQSGEEVTLNGFGKFSRTKRGARTGRNPQTGAPVDIAASTSVKFKASKTLKDAVA